MRAWRKWCFKEINQETTAIIKDIFKITKIYIQLQKSSPQRAHTTQHDKFDKIYTKILYLIENIKITTKEDLTSFQGGGRHTQGLRVRAAPE